ncbi:MAG: hypothetical protein JOZ19_16890 [Rubrobacter sp.]|nr:hypothetical protein [Rubrobacter sp.]
MLLLMQNQSAQGGMFQPLQDAISVFLSYIPQIIGAIIILIVGYIIANSLSPQYGRRATLNRFCWLSRWRCWRPAPHRFCKLLSAAS